VSGRRAAAAVIQFDCDLGNEVIGLTEKTGRASEEDAVAFAERALGLWTVSLAAAAAGVTEESTIVAMLSEHLMVSPLGACQKIVKRVVSERRRQ
jgi:hypothetical protein